MQRPIAVFDSGVGGLAVLKRLTFILPNEDFFYFADNKNMPYGNKSDKQIEKLFFATIKKMTFCNPKAIVIACNTVTSLCIDKLRKEVGDKLIFGIQPAIRQATKPCLVFVTEGTAASKQFCDFASGFDSYIFPLKYGAKLVEKECDDENFCRYLKEELKGICVDKFASVVLGCTHYSHKTNCFKKLGLPVFDGACGLANHVKSTLLAKGLCKKTYALGGVSFFLSDSSVSEYQKYLRLYKEMIVF